MPQYRRNTDNRLRSPKFASGLSFVVCFASANPGCNSLITKQNRRDVIVRIFLMQQKGQFNNAPDALIYKIELFIFRKPS